VLTAGARSILIIEDDVPFARILVDLARELDFKVLVAETAEQGLALAERYRPSAIVLDVGLARSLRPLRAGRAEAQPEHAPHPRAHVFGVRLLRSRARDGRAGLRTEAGETRDGWCEAFRMLEAKFTQKLRRVLVVEDDAVHRESTCRLLASDDVEDGRSGHGRRRARAATSLEVRLHGARPIAARSQWLRAARGDDGGLGAARRP
jgi:CheY-like chemotaxis protein